MGPTGRLVTIKRSGVDGPHFPLSLSTCLFGRGIECDIRIQLPVVSRQHCKIEIRAQKAVLFNFSATNPTQVNGSAISGPVQLKHGDIITVVDRSFRYENDSHQNGRKSAEFPGQRCEQVSLRRVSRSSFSSHPDGKVQDANVAHSQRTEEGVSGGLQLHVEDTGAARTVSRDSEGPSTRSTPCSLGPMGDKRRSAVTPPAEGFAEGAGAILMSEHGGLESLLSTQCLEKDEENESPFRNLYESMKVELDVKSGKKNVLQNRRKSGSWGHCTAESKSAGGSHGETQLWVSPKSRPRSSRRSQTKATPAPGQQGSSQTEEERTEGPGQTLEATVSPSVNLKEIKKIKTPLQCSHQNSSRKRQSQDLSVIRGSEFVNVEKSEGLKADSTLTPKKFFTRQPTPTKGKNVDDFGNTPEKVFSRKRRISLPPNVDILTRETEIQKQTVLTPLLVHMERKVPGGSLGTPQQLGATAGSPGLSSATERCQQLDVSNLGDSIYKIEGMPLKRRRVSFGGHLRPELFDENLPPNTPLKRGETPVKRRSLVTHTPTVLKKIIKEQPQLSEKDDSSEIHLEVTAQNVFVSSPAQDPLKVSSVANDGRRRSSKPPTLSGSKSARQTDAPKRGGRRSSNGPLKKASLGRSQHEILQMIHSRRRSGASEANLIVAKSWADIVKLSAKPAQTKVVKHGPPKQPIKRQRRITTPKKPTGNVHNEFSTGHANSPCTIIIGKAQIEKVNMPAQPCRMLNNFVFNKKVDFNEDLSGLTEMFKTPAKEKPQIMNIQPTTFSNSEDLLGKKFHIPNSEEQALLYAPGDLGKNVFPSAKNAPEEPSEKMFANPALRQQNVTVNEHMKTPQSEAEPPQAASSANKFRRSMQLRNSQVLGTECEKEDTEVNSILENILGSRLRKSSVPVSLPEGEMTDSERSSETCRKNTESKEKSERMAAVRRPRKSSELKCVPKADLIAIKKFQEKESREDLMAIHQVPQTMGHAEKPVGIKKPTKMHGKSPKPELVDVPTKMNTLINMPSQTGNAEDLSEHRKPTTTPGASTHIHNEPADGAETIKAFKETPEQKLNSAENVTGCRRRSRTPKRKVHAIEDLTGFKELFQTPTHIMETVTDDRTIKLPRNSPKPEPVSTPASTKRCSTTPLGKVDMEEDLSVHRKCTPTPGETTCSPREPVGDDKDVKAFKETLEQKVDCTENVTRSRRRSRTPKRKVQAIEDLTGFKELFQTPTHIVETVTVGKTIKLPHKSPKPEPVSTPASTKRRSRAPLRDMDMEDLSLLRKLTPTLGETTCSPREPVGDDKDIKALKETPEQKLDRVENVNEHRRRSRTPKRRVQAIEDLASFKELFQTPTHIVETVTDGKTIKLPHKSPKPEPVSTPASTKRRFRTPLRNMDMEEDLSALRRLTPIPGETTCSPREPISDDKDIKALKETPEQKLNHAENVTGSRRRSRTPKRNVQAIEDLTGFRELFQTPTHIVETVTDDKTIKLPHKSPKPEPVSTTASTKRCSRTPLGKVDMEEDLPALRKYTPTPGETMCSLRDPVSDRDIEASKETPEQKPNHAENVTGNRRRSRTPKRKVQTIEDLTGFKELFQTPTHTVEPVTGDQTTKILCQSPPPEPVISTSMSKLLKTPLGNVDTEKDPSALRKLTPTPGESTCSPREPIGDDKDIKALKETPKQKLNHAQNATGRRRRSRTPTRKVQAIEDLAGFKELFQTPTHIVETVTDGKTIKLPHKSPKPEPVSTPASTKRRSRTPLGKVDMEEDLPALRKYTPTPGKTMCSLREPLGDRDIEAFKETPEQKLNHAKNVTGSRRRSRTPKRKVQTIEDLTSFKELFQTPTHTVEPVTGDQTTKMLCQSPPPEPVIISTSRSRLLKTPLGIVHTEKDPSALRKLTPTPGETTCSPREPIDDDKDIKALKETPEQKLNPAQNATRCRRRSRTPKRKIQAIEDLAGFKELFQTPTHMETVTDGKTIKLPHKSPKPEPVSTPAITKRRFKTSLGNVDMEADLSAHKKPTPTPGEATHTHKEPVVGDESIKIVKETQEQKLDHAENVNGCRRRSRTPKRKVQAIEDFAGFKELFQTPNHTVTEDKIKIACKSPQAKPVVMAKCRNRHLKVLQGKVAVEGELFPLIKPTRTTGKTTQSHREPKGGDKNTKLSRDTPEQKLDPAENTTESKRRPRTRKEKAKLLEDPASFKELFQMPDHTDKPVTAVKTTKMPSTSPKAEVFMPARKKRQLKAPPGKVDVEEQLSECQKPIRTSAKTTRSHREPVGGDKNIKGCKQPPRQKAGPVENAVGIRRQLRSRKEKVQSLEALSHCEQPFQSPAQDKKLGTDAEGITRSPVQTADPSKPVKTSRRVLRAPKVKPLEDLVGTRDPVKSQSESSISLSPKRKCEDGSFTVTRRLRSRPCVPDTAEEKPSRKRQRTAPSERCKPPEPVAMKRGWRVLAESTEPVEDFPGKHMKTQTLGQKVADVTSAGKGMSLRSRLPNRTDGVEQRPEHLKSTEKVKLKRNNKKLVSTSQEVEIQNPEDGAKISTSGHKVRERRMYVRSGRRSKMPLPSGAEEKAKERLVETHVKVREEKGAQHSGVICLRSRTVTAPPPGATPQSQPKQRVTRGSKRSPEDTQKENGDVCIKKIRTRSRRDNEDI